MKPLKVALGLVVLVLVLVGCNPDTLTTLLVSSWDFDVSQALCDGSHIAEDEHVYIANDSHDNPIHLRVSRNSASLFGILEDPNGGLSRVIQPAASSLRGSEEVVLRWRGVEVSVFVCQDEIYYRINQA